MDVIEILKKPLEFKKENFVQNKALEPYIAKNDIFSSNATKIEFDEDNIFEIDSSEMGGEDRKEIRDSIISSLFFAWIFLILAAPIGYMFIKEQSFNVFSWFFMFFVAFSSLFLYSIYFIGKGKDEGYMNIIKNICNSDVDDCDVIVTIKHGSYKSSHIIDALYKIHMSDKELLEKDDFCEDEFYELVKHKLIMKAIIDDNFMPRLKSKLAKEDQYFFNKKSLNNIIFDDNGEALSLFESIDEHGEVKISSNSDFDKLRHIFCARNILKRKPSVQHSQYRSIYTSYIPSDSYNDYVKRYKKIIRNAEN